MIKGNAGDEAARSCFHTQASLSRSVIDAVVPPGGGSKQIADSVRLRDLLAVQETALRSPGYGQRL